MLRGLATSALLGFARRKAGVQAIGTIPAALLTTGASLILTKGRRPVGLAVAALGGFLLWREIEREREAEILPRQGEVAPIDPATP